MNKLFLLKQALKVVEDMIDSGACDLDDAEADELIDTIGKFTNHGVFLSKYEACQLLGLSRSRFDDLVREEKIPKGVAKPGAKELFWLKKDILKYKSQK